ncbi:MAG: host specificity protein, partial [Paracoccaceae bacterium]|nr:host specificity protein [Paracoccaceae bacterium]
ERMLSGANLAAVGDGSADGWEVIRFSHAALVGPGEWEISTRLRGVGGSPVPEAGWPAGSRFVLLDSRVVPMALPLEARGLARQYRVGPAARAPDDPTFRHFVQAFDGIGLRPLSPVHLKAVRDGGDLSLAWVRRTRVGGDSWGAGDVPLSEESERYLLRVVAGGTVKREETVSLPAWTYTAAMQAADGMSGSFELHVAQISAYFGPGLFGRIEIND